MMKICENLQEGNSIKDFTAKEQIFLLDRMSGNLWLFLDWTSLYFDETLFNLLIRLSDILSQWTL